MDSSPSSVTSPILGTSKFARDHVAAVQDNLKYLWINQCDGALSCRIVAMQLTQIPYLPRELRSGPLTLHGTSSFGDNFVESTREALGLHLIHCLHKLSNGHSHIIGFTPCAGLPLAVSLLEIIRQYVMPAC